MHAASSQMAEGCVEAIAVSSIGWTREDIDLSESNGFAILWSVQKYDIQMYSGTGEGNSSAS
jgi:hypothetical protein